MSHAFSLIPNFSQRLPETERVPFHADPVLAAIDLHEECWSVYQVAPGGGATDRADLAMRDALDALLATPCATQAGAFALLRHLRWWLDQECAFAASYQPAYAVAQAREADLTLLLGVDGIRHIPVALPLGRLVPAPVQPVPSTPMRTPLVIDVGPARAPALARLGRAVCSAGETLTAAVLVGGGCHLVGVASLL